jgi:hypothetical protein
MSRQENMAGVIIVGGIAVIGIAIIGVGIWALPQLAQVGAEH